MGTKVAAVFLLAFVSCTRSLHPDAGLNIKELTARHGYPLEVHTVITKDGYVLELHRIPSGELGTDRGIKPVALVLHGLSCSSDAWVAMGPDNGLAYILADSGYDVWLGNHRGTTWSRKHLTLNPTTDKEFWNFSYHEVGIYDNTALIDYILNCTKQEKLFYIGHSQGATSFFAMTSLLPEYNRKIRLMVGLAPAAYTNNIKSLLVLEVYRHRHKIWKFMATYKMYGLFMHSQLIKELTLLFCNDKSSMRKVCDTVSSMISGFNDPQMHKDLFVLTAGSMPAGASWKQVAHYFQGFKTGKFRLYDYGRKLNMEKYGQEKPPSYNLQNISSPVAIYYGNNDYLTTDENVVRLSKNLPNVVSMKLVQDFNHIDFLWAVDVVPLLYEDVLKIMKDY